jgi:hypothetical protein
MRVFIRVNAHTCMSIYVCTVFLKKGLVDPLNKQIIYIEQ